MSVPAGSGGGIRLGDPNTGLVTFMGDPVSQSPKQAHVGRYDAGAHRQSLRRGRERGCWVYVAGVELEAAGIDLDAPPPAYRIWGGRRGSALVRFYGSRS